MPQNNYSGKPKLIHPTPGHRGMTELHYAAYCNDPEAIHAELQRGISADIRDNNGWTPLHWSIDMAQAGGKPKQVVSLLLAAGASPNAVDHAGCSVLMMACGRNNEAIFEQLITAGADIHSRSRSGTTALHEAAGCNFSEAIRRLLTLGADPSQLDERNRTPEEVAVKCGFDESIAVFRKGAWTLNSSRDGETAMPSESIRIAYLKRMLFRLESEQRRIRDLASVEQWSRDRLDLATKLVDQDHAALLNELRLLQDGI